MNQTPLIVLAVRVYRVVLRLYPTPYFREYGDGMVQVFRDMSRAAYTRQGSWGLVRWWVVVLFDLIQSIIEERREFRMTSTALISPKRAAVISLLLCLPLSYMLVTAVLHIEPPFSRQLQQVMYDNYQPTTIGKLIMLGMLVALPAAFLINLLSMVTKPNPEAAPFKPTLPHIVVGISSLVFVLITLARQVLHELSPFTVPLGSASLVGQVLFFLGLLILPAALLFNRLPPLATVGLGGRLAFQPSSINLIIGAVILLVILMAASVLVLEIVACSSGVPNCD